MNFTAFLRLISLLLIFLVNTVIPQGKVYLVIGSDTAIWNNMSVSGYNNTYNLELFTAPASNTDVVMSESFREPMVDSYGNKIKMTWWMMAGNIFRYATNNNIPINNIMTLHLMKKFYGDKVELFGDELTLHYHTFAWSDYDNDGIYWWNQAQTFLETKNDFDFTLAQFLLEENIFPVSFRSGWHYMDNDWQNYLNEILPYSLHNDWPAVRFTTTEPIANVYDWSQSSPEFVPFNPDPENYQLQGNSKGWNVRSKYLGYVTTEMVNSIFQKAEQGTDQLACFWSHLPDQNFLNEIQQMNNIVQQVAADYPDVQFKYCTAIEAYQLWLQSNDEEKPELQLTEQINGSDVKFQISTNEPIFQTQPFVAIKDRYERYMIAECESISTNTWQTILSYPLNDIGKAGAAVTDTIGTLSTSFITYLPDDKFIDNDDPLYSEVNGNWSTSSNTAWNTSSRITNLNPGDSAKVRWNLETGHSGLHNLFIQFPEVTDHIDTIYFEYFKNGSIEDTLIFPVNNKFRQWLYVKTVDLISGEDNYIEMSAKNNGQSIQVLSADIFKVSAYVRDRELSTGDNLIELGEVSIEDSIYFDLDLSNSGIYDLTVSNVYSLEGNLMVDVQMPFNIQGMSKYELPLIFIPDELGPVEDTLIIESNDPINAVYKIPFTALVQKYFLIVDNDDLEGYSETGNWQTSVTQAYGNSSRYALLTSAANSPAATFSFMLSKTGVYDILEILPPTVNATNNALYKISENGVLIDSFYLDQNQESGAWKNVGQYFLHADVPVSVKVIDTGQSSAGLVIRADAFKIELFEETTDIDNNDLISAPDEFYLHQNYPNPFNPTTIIRYSIPDAGTGHSVNGGLSVTLKVYDVLGNEVALLVNEEKSAGNYQIKFDASSLSSGVYFYSIQADNFFSVRKMLLLK